MARKRYKPEEIVAKLRQVDVLVSQGQNMVETQLLAPSILLPPCTAHVQMSGVRNSARAIRSKRPFRPSSSRKGGRVMARIRRSRKIFPTIFPSN